MLSDEQLEIISEALVPLFQYLEAEVIADLAERIAESLSYTRTAELSAIAMRELGYSPAKIRHEAMKLLRANPAFRKNVAKNTLEHKRKVRKLLNEISREAYDGSNEILQKAADTSWAVDLAIWKEAGRELTDDSFLPQLVEAFARQTRDELKNLTRTTGFKTMSGYEPIESLYQKELDKAMIKVCTGTFSKDKVIADTVHELAKSGLRSINFESGYSMQLDTAVRLAVRTGCHQISGRIMDRNMENTSENLVYVSRHQGARNVGEGVANHERWQGKVYYIKPERDYSAEAARIGQDQIRDLWEETGYSVDGAHENDPRGLYGYNCRHRYYVWFEGIDILPPELKTPKPVTVDGKTYDYYAMTQKMRSMERDVRALKREKEALGKLDMDTKETEAKIRQKTAAYKEFCETCKIKPKTERLRYECGTSDLRKTKAWKKFEGHAAGDKKVITDTEVHDTMKIAKEKQVTDMTEIYDLGKVNTEVFEKKFGKILTDDVIITNERKAHIQLRHPEDYELFDHYGHECIQNPDLIISDEKNAGTVFMIKKLEDTNLNVVLRLVLECDDRNLKNSVMTFWRIRNKNLQKLIEKNEIIYKKE